MKYSGSLSRILLLVLMIAAACMSGYALYSQSIRLDEAQSIWISTKPLLTILKLTAQDVQMPLYPVLLHFWIQIFGTSIALARTLSFLFFLATLPVLYMVSKESANKTVALITTAFFALSPFVIWYSSEARTYTIFTFVTCLSHLYFLRMIRSNAQRGKAGYALATLLGLFTHYFFAFLVLTQICFIAWFWLRDVRNDTKVQSLWRSIFTYRALPISCLWIWFIDGLLFLPWFVYFLSMGAGANESPLIPPPTTYNLFQTFVTFVFGFQSQTLQALLIALWPLAVLLLFFIFTQKRTVFAKSIEYFFLATFLPVVLVFGASFVRPIFLSRYLILTTPTLFFLLAWLLLNYSKTISAYLLTILLASMFGLLILQNISTQTPVKEDYRDVANYLAASATPQDIVVITPPFTIYPVEYSYHGYARLDTLPLWDRYQQGAIPAFTEQGLVQQVNTYKQQYRRMFVVFSYDQGYQSAIQHYLDHTYQMDYRRTFSPGLEVRVYQLRYD